MRSWIAICVVVLASTTVGPEASAQSHYLLARTNGSFQGESTFDVNVDHVEHLYQQGVGGVNPSFCSISASTSGASGGMGITGTWSLIGGAADPIQPPTTYHSATRIAQDLDPGNPTGDVVTVHATLLWDGGADMESVGDIDRTSLSAQLRLGECQAYFRRSFYSHGLVEDAPIDCAEANAVGTAEPGAIDVTLTYPSAAVSGLTRFHVDAQLAADIDNPVEYGDSGQYQVNGTLFVEVAGLDGYEFQSPTFLTAPEAGSEAGAAVELAAVLALARRRRRRSC